MFLPKVGSDPCLVLTGHYDSDNAQLVIDETFDAADLIKAAQTKVVSCVLNITDSEAFCGPIVAMTANDFVIVSYNIDNGVVPYEFVTDGNGVWYCELS